VEFSAAIPAWKIAPALAYGNCVVFKPPTWSRLGLALGRHHLARRRTAGAFNLVMGRGSVVGEALVNDKRVDAISFTGSVETGQKIAQKAVARMAKFQLEMGGKNPLVVLDDADLKTRWNRGERRVLLTGQRCTASSRLIVTKGIHNNSSKP
jgi:aldehyde dehydrogenase (NAD+)